MTKERNHPTKEEVLKDPELRAWVREKFFRDPDTLKRMFISCFKSYKPSETGGKPSFVKGGVPAHLEQLKKWEALIRPILLDMSPEELRTIYNHYCPEGGGLDLTLSNAGLLARLGADRRRPLAEKVILCTIDFVVQDHPQIKAFTKTSTEWLQNVPLCPLDFFLGKDSMEFVRNMSTALKRAIASKNTIKNVHDLPKPP